MSSPTRRLVDGLLLSWYGDDFTGSSAVVEVLTQAGLPAVLFLDIPTPELLKRFSGFRGMGVAGVARSKSPQWMEANLPFQFEALAAWSAPIAHYKICSTLDSAPNLGSIGKACELAEPHFRSSWVPFLVAAPSIHRYQFFGNLFAGADGIGFRLDRHPTMSRHPATPMHEADVRLHLGHQTATPIGLVDWLALRHGQGDARLQSELSAGRRLVAIDVIDDGTLIEAGRLIWEKRDERIFAVGSQGVEYALIAYWRSSGMLASEAWAPNGLAAEPVAVVSGSCSPVTAKQIAWARVHGFEAIHLDVRCALDERAWPRALAAAIEGAIRAIGVGRDPIVFTALGPDDPTIADLHEAVNSSSTDLAVVNEVIGLGLGKVLESIVRGTRIRRVVLAGGDTSGHAARALRIRALTLLATTVPGAGLFVSHSDDPDYDGLEIAFKGGQMGSVDYFGQIKNGGVSVPS